MQVIVDYSEPYDLRLMTNLNFLLRLGELCQHLHVFLLQRLLLLQLLSVNIQLVENRLIVLVEPLVLQLNFGYFLLQLLLQIDGTHHVMLASPPTQPFKGLKNGKGQLTIHIQIVLFIRIDGTIRFYLPLDRTSLHDNAIHLERGFVPMPEEGYISIILPFDHRQKDHFLWGSRSGHQLLLFKGQVFLGGDTL
jgi:hypothetical protein